MTSERKAFRALYRMISNGNITEKEAFEIADAIFAVNIQYVPSFSSSPTDEQPNNMEATPPPLEVRGFLPNN